jgi:hypothetical protein
MIENPEYLKGFNSYAQVHNKTKDSPPPDFGDAVNNTHQLD